MSSFFSSGWAGVAGLHQALFLALNPDPIADGETPWVITVARFASTVLPELLIGLLLAALLLGPRIRVARRHLLQVFAAMAIAWLLARGIQAQWPQQRPFALGIGTPWLAHAASASFPSMHATMAVAWASALILACRPQRWMMGLCATLALAIALSRVVLGLHFPIDVLVGAGLGVASAALTHRYWPKRGTGQVFTGSVVRWCRALLPRRG